MIQYGIYTVKELDRFTKGLTSKKKINILSECSKCDFVYNGSMCLNCYPWNTVRWRATCPRDRSSSAIIICAQRDSSLNAYTESVWRRDINLINLQNGYTGNMVKWSSNVKLCTVTLYHSHVYCVEKQWKSLIYVGPHMTVYGGYIAKKHMIYPNHYQQLNKNGI